MMSFLPILYHPDANGDDKSESLPIEPKPRSSKRKIKMTSKRIYIPKAKPGQLLVKWGRVEPGEPAEIVYAWGGSGASKPDARLLSKIFEDIPVFDGKCLADVLKERGYDLTTLRFSIDKKKESE